MPASEKSPGEDSDSLSEEDVAVLKRYLFGQEQFLSLKFKFEVTLASGDAVAAYVTIMKIDGIWRAVPSD